jgi:hypothetical protein
MYRRTGKERNKALKRQTGTRENRESSEVRRWCAIEMRYYARCLLAAVADWALARERAR